MGSFFLDQFSLLHFAVGVVVYFWGIGFWSWVIIHAVFEILENTETGIWFINHYLIMWPGGKTHADTLLNQVGDVWSGSVGWLVAKLLDTLGQRQQWTK